MAALIQGQARAKPNRLTMQRPSLGTANTPDYKGNPMHPYKDQADSSRKNKASTMGKAGNLDIPVMRAAGENNSKKLYSSSSASMQFKKQGAADGMKRGGHVGKHKHSKPKIVIAAPDPTAAPPPPDASLAAAGAGSSPAPAPMPPPGAMPPGGAPPMKIGGMVKRRGGGDSGVGRLEKIKMIKGGLKPIGG